MFQAAIDEKPKGKTCSGIVGIIEEGTEITLDYKGSAALDAGLIAAAQAVEHYEISRYGALIAWAEQLGLEDAGALLEETLEEEKGTDETLSELAEAINQQAEDNSHPRRVARVGQRETRSSKSAQTPKASKEPKDPVEL